MTQAGIDEARGDDLTAVVARELASGADPRLLVGIDGVDGAGKTVFADRLAHHVERLGVACARVSADDYHQPRAVRYRQGRDSPVGFFEDSYDLALLRSQVLGPFRENGSYVRRAHDLDTDASIEPVWETCGPRAVLVVDGIFAHRDELAALWDRSVFLHVPFEVTAQRMAARDGTDPDPEHASMRRYVEGQRVYFRRCRPWERATWVIDNTEPSAARRIAPVVFSSPR